MKIMEKKEMMAKEICNKVAQILNDKKYKELREKIELPENVSIGFVINLSEFTNDNFLKKVVQFTVDKSRNEEVFFIKRNEQNFKTETIG